MGVSKGALYKAIQALPNNSFGSSSRIAIRDVLTNSWAYPLLSTVSINPNPPPLLSERVIRCWHC